MRALVCSELSDDLSGVGIKDLPSPEPGPGQVKIRVRAASVNFPDILMTQGGYQYKPDLPFIIGIDFAGDVIGLGEGVTDFAVGDRVVGGSKTGAFCEERVIEADALRTFPDAFSYAEAASYGAAYITAYVGLVVRGNLQPGETLLVHGATGGVGLAAVDVGKLLGATVVATSGSDEKLQAVKAYGADHVLNTRDGFRDQVKALTGGRGADVIFDPIGGDVFDESTRCIAFDGRILIIGFMSGRYAELKTNIALIKGFSVIGVRAGEYGRRFPEKGKAGRDVIWKWAAERKTRPLIHAEFPLELGKEALQMVIDRKFVGKVVIMP